MSSPGRLEDTAAAPLRPVWTAADRCRAPTTRCACCARSGRGLIDRRGAGGLCARSGFSAADMLGRALPASYSCRGAGPPQDLVHPLPCPRDAPGPRLPACPTAAPRCPRPRPAGRTPCRRDRLGGSRRALAQVPGGRDAFAFGLLAAAGGRGPLPAPPATPCWPATSPPGGGAAAARRHPWLAGASFLGAYAEDGSAPSPRPGPAAPPRPPGSRPAPIPGSSAPSRPWRPRGRRRPRTRRRRHGDDDAGLSLRRCPRPRAERRGHRARASPRPRRGRSGHLGRPRRGRRGPRHPALRRGARSRRCRSAGDRARSRPRLVAIRPPQRPGEGPPPARPRGRRCRRWRASGSTRSADGRSRCISRPVRSRP